MKKILLTKLIVLIVVLAVLLSITGLMISQNSWNLFDYTNMHFNSQSDEKMIIDETYNSVTEIDVKMLEENINVKTYDGNDVIIKYYGNKKREPKIQFNNGILSIKHEKKIMFTFFDFKEGHLEITVPSKQTIDTHLSTASGNIVVEAITDYLDLESVSGNILVKNEGNIGSFSTVSGDIDVYKPFSEVKFNSVSGNVSLDSKRDMSVKGDTVSGNIYINLCNGCGYDVRFKSVSGEVVDDFEDTKYQKKANFRLGDGSLRFDIETVSGDLEFTDWD